MEALKTEFDGKGLRFSQGGIIDFHVLSSRAGISATASAAWMRTASTSPTYMGIRPVFEGMTLRSMHTPRLSAIAVVSHQDTVQQYKGLFFPETAHKA